ncbi:MAG: hypothetical protein Kow0040_24400 [Thermogutta sp.]
MQLLTLFSRIVTLLKKEMVELDHEATVADLLFKIALLVTKGSDVRFDRGDPLKRCFDVVVGLCDFLFDRAQLPAQTCFFPLRTDRGGTVSCGIFMQACNGPSYAIGGGGVFTVDACKTLTISLHGMPYFGNRFSIKFEYSSHIVYLRHVTRMLLASSSKVAMLTE